MIHKESSTKDKILDTAEILFAEKGYHATSIRDITGAADLHIGSVNYHFSSKEKLFQALCSRKISQINDERLSLLDRLEETGESLKVEDILTTFLAPPLRFGDEGHHSFMRLMARIYVEPGKIWAPIFELFEDVVRRYSAAFSRALPQLSKSDLIWRFHFMVGAMCHTLLDTQGISLLSQNNVPLKSTEELIEELVSFTAAGFKAGVKVSSK